MAEACFDLQFLMKRQTSPNLRSWRLIASFLGSMKLLLRFRWQNPVKPLLCTFFSQPNLESPFQFPSTSWLAVLISSSFFIHRLIGSINRHQHDSMRHGQYQANVEDEVVPSNVART